MQHPNELIVMEYGGTARSGKGSVVQHLAEVYEGVAAEETGADYRAVTSHLLSEGMIEPEMSPEAIASVITGVGSAALAEIVANRNELVRKAGIDSLHVPEVSGLVGHISPLADVRTAVKAGFTKRVEAVRDGGKHQILLVDGRNLAPVVRKIPGASLLLRTFLSVGEREAGIRECLRAGLAPHSEAGRQVIEEEAARVAARNKLDAERATDPVRPDTDAIDYWYNQEAMRISARVRSIERRSIFEPGYDEAQDYNDWLNEKNHHAQQLRHGVASTACRDHVQIKFDTGIYRDHYENPFEGMLTAARTMFEEATGMRPVTDSLANRSRATLLDLSEVELKVEYLGKYFTPHPMSPERITSAF